MAVISRSSSTMRASSAVTFSGFSAARFRFPNCTHTHESHCAVKDAVADGRLDLRRYESYCKMFARDV